MKKNLMLVIFMLIASFCFAEKSGGLDDDKYARLDAYLADVAASYHVPGMAFFVTDADETLFEKSYGECTSLNQKFFIGSESKSFTALCIMQLEEKGLVNLNDDVAQYLPEYSFSKPVTVRMLLNQNSGFDTHAKLKNVCVTDSYGKFEYANVNYDLLGKIVEAASGMSYSEYIRKNVFLPLEMNDCAADAQSLKGDKNLLRGNRNFFGLFISGDASWPKENSWFHEAAGFISATPHDFQKYLRLYLNGGTSQTGEQVISGESIKRMWYDSIEQGTNSGEKYGMGWNSGNFGGEDVLFHGGQVENYITFMTAIPAKKIAFSFMVNGNDEFGMNNLMNDAVLGVVNILNGKNPPPAKKSSYILIHAALDFVYLVILLLSVFILIKSLHPKQCGRTKKIIMHILAWCIWPLFLFTIVPLAFKTPLWVVKSYVPDLFIVLVCGIVLSLAGAVVACGRFVWRLMCIRLKFHIKWEKCDIIKTL